MATFDTIILPFDGSAVAETAIPFAAELARVTGARLIVLRVLEEMRPIYDARTRLVVWLDPDNPRQDVLSPEILQPVVERLAREGITAEPVVRLGDPRQEIIREAEAHHKPVIVLASHGRGGLGRILLGSVVTRVVQMSVCPVVVVRAREPGEQPEQVRLQLIAVPLDGSPLAEQALPFAVGLAKDAGSELRLVRVAETYRDELPPEPPNTLVTPSFRAILERFDELEREARDYLASMAERIARESGLEVSWKVLSGDPFRQMLEFAEHDQPDLIVITTHGRGGLARWLYGSVTDKLLTSSRVPLMVIRATQPKAG